MRAPRHVIPWVLVGVLTALVSGFAQEKPALRIIVIAGEEAVNIIQQKTAVAPIVEVRDRNDLPVAGVPVTFTIAGKSASFGGAQTITITTNAAGRAAASALTPVSNGAVQIQVTAAFQGQTAAATITQTNVATAAQAGSSGVTAAAGGGGGALSGATIGLIAAGIGGGGAVVALAAKKEDSSTSSTTSTGTPPAVTSPTPPTPPTATPAPAPAPAPPANRAPVVGAPSFARAVVLVGMQVSFSAAASDADGDALAYSWDFGDGNTSTQQSPTHTFQRGGAFMVRVTVRDRESAGNAEAPITVKLMTGRWDAPSTPDEIGDFTLTQIGTTISGSQKFGRYEGNRLVQIIECPVSGTVQSSAPHVILTRANCDIAGLTFYFELDAAADTLMSRDSPLIWTRR